MQLDVGVAQRGVVTEGEPVVAAADRRAHGHEAHDLDSGSDGDVVGAGDHALCGEVCRLLRRAALAVDGGGRARSRGIPAPSTALRPTLIDCAPTCMTQPMITSSTRPGSTIVRVHARFFRHLGGQVGWMPAREGSVALAPGGAEGIDDHCGSHGGVLLAGPVVGPIGWPEVPARCGPACRWLVPPTRPNGQEFGRPFPLSRQSAWLNRSSRRKEPIGCESAAPTIGTSIPRGGTQGGFDHPEQLDRPR